MTEQIRKLVQNEKFCVLATASENKPYCSLMAYAPEEDCKKIYMVTHKNTVKYENLIENSAVSLLIDTREEKDKSQNNITKALTITGHFFEIKNESVRLKARDFLHRRHPDLGVFLDHPQAFIFGVEVQSFLLLEGFTDSHYEVISSPRDVEQ